MSHLGTTTLLAFGINTMCAIPCYYGGQGYVYGCGCGIFHRLGWGSGYGGYGYGSAYRYGCCCPSCYGGYWSSGFY
ncbi:keratin-associated protein 19-7-like [Cavia porcellus]|uniref:keratin-associated protein 19-7-like n=1 Tax=Cavia porcellus TaxID=10141 RepID=UPI002FE0EF74